jgi:hypothetical protein
MSAQRTHRLLQSLHDATPFIGERQPRVQSKHRRESAFITSARFR